MMKTVVLSTNNNDDYLFFLPIVAWAWRKFGWDVVAFYPYGEIDDSKIRLLASIIHTPTVIPIGKIDGIRSETIAQCCRLYAATRTDGYIMTGDIDMLPLSDYWKVNPDVVTTWGHDLTGFVHYPICYVGMSSAKWKEVMKLNHGPIENDMQRDLDLHPKSKSDNWEEWWQVDQDILTERLNEYGDVHKVLRGIAPNSHYPLGRVDRGAWELSIQQPERIDAHLLRPGYDYFNFQKILQLIGETFPGEDLQWMIDYKNEYLNFVK